MSALSGLTNLERLYLYNNGISDIAPLSGLTNLESLNLSNNSISDIAPLVANMGLRARDNVDVKGNPLSDTSLDTHIPILQGRGIAISFDPLRVSDYPLPVSIPDANLRAVIEHILGKTSGAPITRGEMLSVTQLVADNADIKDLTGLEFAIYLRNLYPSNNRISDITPLSGLTSLRNLNLSNNRISDVSALSGLINLTTLWLYGNRISDVSALSELTSIDGLILYNNSISDIAPLSGLTSLRYLYLSNNSISDISPLSSLANLERLVLDNNAISDIAPLVANMGLGSGDLVDVSNNPLSATSINTHIPTLQSRGVSVSFGASKPAVGEQERDISHIERGETDDYMYRRQMEEEMHRIRQKLSLPTKTGM